MSYQDEMRNLAEEVEVIITKEHFTKEESQRVLLLTLNLNTHYQDYIDEYHESSMGRNAPFDLATLRISTLVLMSECDRSQLTLTMVFIKFAISKLKKEI